MAWITRRRLTGLKGEIVKLTYRVAELEERLCPCEQHDWVRVDCRLQYSGSSEPMSIYRYKCRVCGKGKEDIV